MAQQINLYHPILLTTKRYFSARAMAQGLVAVAAGTLLLCGWTVMQTRRLQRDLQATQHLHETERQALVTAIANKPHASTNTTALEQTLKALQPAVAQRQQTLDELTRGTVASGHTHSAMLRLVAQTVPPAVWLTEIKLTNGPLGPAAQSNAADPNGPGADKRIGLIGMTLDPAVLRPWMAQLSAHPLLTGQPLAAIQVEQRPAPAQTNTAGAPRSQGKARGGVDAWSFSLGSHADLIAARASAANAAALPHANQMADAAIASVRVSNAASAAAGARP